MVCFAGLNNEAKIGLVNIEMGYLVVMIGERHKPDLQQSLLVIPPILRSPSILICGIIDWGIYHIEIQ